MLTINNIYTTLIDFNSPNDLTLPLVIVGLVILSSYIIYSYTQFCEFSLYYGFKAYRGFCGMRIKSVPRKYGKGEWCYSERGTRGISKYPTLIFLHGFGADKDTWLLMTQYIPKEFHCVLLDFPGHGGTTFIEGSDEPTVISYVHSLREFLEMSGFDKDKFNIIGCSLGGGVSGLFAHYYPGYIHKLCAFCPAMKTPILTKTCEKLLSGSLDLLIPRNGKELLKMMSIFLNRPPPYPERIMDAFINLNYTLAKRNRLKKLWENIVNEEFANFDKKLYRIQSIKCDTLIVWGEDDEMLHVSGGYLLHKNVENSKLRVIKNCNHGIQLDQPKISSQHLMDFFYDKMKD